LIQRREYQLEVQWKKRNLVRVTEWQFEPGAATGHHRHEFDYVVVPLVDGVLRLVAAGGESSAELRKGVAYFRKAGGARRDQCRR
jgi:quercetin dioxygenase-like cupin family protein